MMFHRIVPILTVIAILPSPAAAADAREPSSQTALKTKVECLIAELDAPTRKRRLAAERELAALGPNILPLLPPPELLPNVAVREAVRRLRIGLERRKAIQSVRPSQVTLSGELTLTEILTAISGQTGNPIDFSRLPDAVQRRRHPVKFTERDFWPALDEIVARAGLGYDHAANANRVVLVVKTEKSTGEPAVAYSGPFRIAVTGARVRPFPVSGPHRVVRVNYRVSAEPRLRPLFAQYRGDDFRAKSASGHTLPPFSPDAHPEIPLGEGGRHLNLQCDFLVPAGEVPESLSFHGKLTLTVAAGEEQIEFTQLSQAVGTARRRGGVTVKLQGVELAEPTETGRAARFQVIISYDAGGPAFESHRTWIFHNRVYLENAQGERIERDGLFHTNLQADGAVVVEYGFRNLPTELDEYRFVYVAPTLLVKLPIEFDVPDIPVTTSMKPERKQP